MKRLRAMCSFCSGWRGSLPAAALCLTIACSELLPPYQDPQDVFAGTMSAVYAISHLDNSVKVYLTIVNSYDETLTSPAILEGSCTVVWLPDPTFRKTVRLTPGHVIYARQYDRETGILTLDAGDSIRLGFSWDLVSDAGVNIRQRLVYREDPTCRGQMISEPQVLLLSGELKVFGRTPTTTAQPERFVFRHIHTYVRCGL